jgi:hypothetical protein
MEFAIQYNEEFFEIRTSGDAEFQKFRDILEALVNHDRWEPGKSFLMNHTELNPGTLTLDHMRSIAEFNAQYSAKMGLSRCALLVTSDVAYGMGRVWEAFVEEKWNVTEKLFRSRDEAIEWLSGKKNEND